MNDRVRQIERLKSKQFAVCCGGLLLIMDGRGEYETINGKEKKIHLYCIRYKYQ